MTQKVTEALAWRYATQTFKKDVEISEEDLKAILEAGNLTATAYGLQPFEFIAITDQQKKNELSEILYNQKHLVENSALIVCAIRTDVDETYIAEYIERMATIRAVPVESLEPFRQSMIKGMGSKGQEGRDVWSTKQAYIALGSMMVAASELCIDNHAAEGFDAAKLDAALGLGEKNLHSVVVLALGYRTDNPSEKDALFRIKVRKKYEDIVTVL